MRLQTIKLLVVASVVILIIVVERGTAFNAPAVRGEVSANAQGPDPAEVVDALDRAIQKRFHNVIGFGMARIAREKKFVPETEEEKQAVNSLEKGRVRVGLYLAGRLVLEPKPSELQWGPYGVDRAVSRPLFIGSQTKPKDLPGQLDLWEHAQRALDTFASGKDLYEFTEGEWSFRAHPVRASDSSCLRCHSQDFRLVYPAAGVIGYEIKGSNNLKVGDPIGMLLYAYSPSR